MRFIFCFFTDTNQNSLYFRRLRSNVVTMVNNKKMETNEIAEKKAHKNGPIHI